jgi:hypothetical protein
MVLATSLDLFMPCRRRIGQQQNSDKKRGGKKSRPAPFGQAPLLNLPDAIPASGNQQPNRQDSPRKRI